MIYRTLAVVLLVPTIGSAAPPKVDSLFPVGVERGGSAVVTASGSFSSWPVKVHVHRSGLTVRAAKDKGKFEISADKEAPQGVYLIRAYDAEGAAVERPFYVGRLPEVVEVEPNNDPTKPQKLSHSAVVSGRLAKSGDVDGYSIPLRKGQTIVAAVEANRTLGSPMDGVVQVCDAAGFVLAQNDDGRGLDPLVTFTADRDGDFLVRLFAFPTTANSTIGFAGAATFIYRLTLDTEGYVDHTLPLAVQRGVPASLQLRGWNVPPSESKLSIKSDSELPIQVAHGQLSNTLTLPVVDYPSLVAGEQTTPKAVSAPCCVSGVIEAPKDRDLVRVSLKKGAKLNCRVESFALGYPLDPLLRVLDGSGKTLQEVDDTKGPDGRLTFTAPADGDFDIEVSDLHGHGGFRYAYRLRIETPQPDFALGLAAGELTLAAGKPLEVQVNVTRSGFSEPIELRVEGLPAGVTCPAVMAGPKDKSVKLKLTGDGKPHSGAIQVVGVAGDRRRLATRETAGLTVDTAWLTATGK